MHGYRNEHKGTFDPDEIRTLATAFEKAWESVQASGAKFETGAHAEAARAVLAKHIIDAAEQGELDQRRLRDGALVAWAQSNLPSVSAPRRPAVTSSRKLGLDVSLTLLVRADETIE